MGSRVRLIGILISLLAVAIIASVSVAAAADLHPTGYDGNCNLCQFSKSPLIIAGLQFFLQSSDNVDWEIPHFKAFSYQEFFFTTGGCRAPPSLFSFC